VPDLSHDTAEDGFHEIQLSGKQLVFLFIVTTTVVVGVFLFGVLVGRGARETRADSTPGPATTSTAPSTPDAATSEPPPMEPPPVASDEPPSTSQQALKGQDSARETPRTAPPDANPAPPETKTTPAPLPVSREPVAKPDVAPAPRKSSSPNVPSAGTPGVWLVQVIATRDQEVATSVVKRLGAKGYPAFLVNPVPGAAQPFYKVQIGRYKDRSEAEQVSQRIKKEEQFQSWILR
jgi:cell division septation protein DedD